MAGAGTGLIALLGLLVPSLPSAASDRAYRRFYRQGGTLPDRIIRDELLTSERYWSVGIEAQRLFVHLLLNADALGRFSGKNYTIRAGCYPGHAIDPKLVEKLLLDLHDADLIRIYEHEGARYVFIPRYRQRLKAKCSYYPPPPSLINDIVEEKADSWPPQGRPQAAEGSEGREVNLPRKPPDPVNAQVWNAYADAYAARYRERPVRNASVNSQIINLVKRLGSEAPQVATFYLSHNDAFYIKKRHPMKLLLADAEGLRTQWKTGTKATTLEARSAEQRDGLHEQYKRLIGEQK